MLSLLSSSRSKPRTIVLRLTCGLGPLPASHLNQTGTGSRKGEELFFTCEQGAAAYELVWESLEIAKFRMVGKWEGKCRTHQVIHDAAHVIWESLGPWCGVVTEDLVYWDFGGHEEFGLESQNVSANSQNKVAVYNSPCSHSTLRSWWSHISRRHYKMLRKEQTIYEGDESACQILLIQAHLRHI